MGDHEGWAQPSGLLPNEAATVMRVLDMDRWSKAEARTAELITFIQPNQSSEERRKAVADYVQQLIMKCFSCQVAVFFYMWLLLTCCIKLLLDTILHAVCHFNLQQYLGKHTFYGYTDPKSTTIDSYKSS